MTNLYTPKQIQEMLGVSPTALRIYTATYPDQLTTEATGKRRKFTVDDMRWLSFVKERTDVGDSHKQILEEMTKAKEAGTKWALWEEFAAEWEAPEGPEPSTEGVGSNSTAMVPIAQYQTMHAFLLDAQRREEELREEIRERDTALLQLQRELGRVEGELAASKVSKPKGFWARLLGGGE